jgi:hypothetical protein
LSQKTGEKDLLNIAIPLRLVFLDFPGNVWQVPAHNKNANLWISKVLGTVKTKAEAQAIVDAEVQVAQAAWDALPAEEKATRQRPADIVLVE